MGRLDNGLHRQTDRTRIYEPGSIWITPSSAEPKPVSIDKRLTRCSHSSCITPALGLSLGKHAECVLQFGSQRPLSALEPLLKSK